MAISPPFTLRSAIFPEVFLESDAELSSNCDWTIPPLLLRSMNRGIPVHVDEAISCGMARNLEEIQSIYCGWSPAFQRVPVTLSCTTRTPSTGTSLFYSGGVDSLYSLAKHASKIDNLVLIHGFDVPLDNAVSLRIAETQAKVAADHFGKRLLVLRTNIHWEQKPDIPGGWGLYHGAALAAAAHALAPHHRTIYIASTYSYLTLHPWGSHPLLDPLWSSEAVRVVHDTCETRTDKLRLLVQYPELLPMLRVCWENTGAANCGECEKCLRTMIALLGLGVERCSAFPDTLTVNRVREKEPSDDALLFWRELVDLDLPKDIHRAVQSVISCKESKLPPRNGNFRREVRRCMVATQQTLSLFRKLL